MILFDPENPLPDKEMYFVVLGAEGEPLFVSGEYHPSPTPCPKYDQDTMFAGSLFADSPDEAVAKFHAGCMRDMFP